MKKVSLGLCEVNSCMRQAIQESVHNGQKLHVCAHHSAASFWSSKNEVILDRSTIEQPDRATFQQEGHSKKSG